jgi:hypothetical protein
MKRLTAIAATVLMVLAMAAPASADTVSVGGLVAGPFSDNITVAGSPALASGPTPQLPLGTDIAAAGNPFPPNPFALGVNVPLNENLAVAGVGPFEDDVVAQSSFFGGDFATAGSGALDVEVDN